MGEKKYFIWAVLFVFVVSFIRFNLISSFELVPQEAYYWLYIQYPSLGYFDHPPMCSYTIGLFSKVFGDNEMGVRFGMLLYSIGTMLFIFLLSRRIFNDNKVAFRTIIFLNMTIFFNIHSIIATPDSPLLFFWAGSIYFFYKAVNDDKSILQWILAGIFTGLSIYSKYTGVFLYLSLFLYLFFSNKRKFLFTFKPYLAIAVSLIVFSPVIYWNLNNEWASFLFQSKGRADNIKRITLIYFLQLIASQLFELTPLFFILGITIFVKFIKRYKSQDEDRKLLLWFSYPIILVFYLISFTSLVKMNWILPAYLSMILLVSNVYDEFSLKSKQLITHFGFPTSLLFILLLLWTITIPTFPIEKGDTWNGWKELAEKVTYLIQSKYKNQKVFIFSNDYKIPAELSFYTKFKHIILAENVYGKPALQFDFWFKPKQFEHWDALFIFSDYNKFSDFEMLKNFFDKIELIEEVQIIRNNNIYRRFWIYYCQNYLIKDF
ncbi:MAG: glycosyltransferase family 39 protein [Candidatus Kapaibacteriales bacterium]